MFRAERFHTGVRTVPSSREQLSVRLGAHLPFRPWGGPSQALFTLSGSCRHLSLPRLVCRGIIIIFLRRAVVEFGEERHISALCLTGTRPGELG